MGNRANPGRIPTYSKRNINHYPIYTTLDWITKQNQTKNNDHSPSKLSSSLEFCARENNTDNLLLLGLGIHFEIKLIN